jgi:hypothetical protein
MGQPLMPAPRPPKPHPEPEPNPTQLNSTQLNPNLVDETHRRLVSKAETVGLLSQ